MKMRLVNTVEMDFGRQPALQMLSVHRWLRSLGVKDEQVYGIMAIVQTEAKIIRLKFKEESDYKSFFDRYAGMQSMELENGIIQVTVREAGVKEVFVRLMDVPFETTGDAIKSALQPFGTVLMIRREKYMGSTDNDYFQVLNGTVTAKMTLIRHVPSYLRISNERIVVRYPGQPATCMICNQPGHMAASCSVRRTNNRFAGKWAEMTPQQAQHPGNAKGAMAEFPSEKVNSAKVWPTPAESVRNHAQKITTTPEQEKDPSEGRKTVQNIEENSEERSNDNETKQQEEVTTQDLELSMVVLAPALPEERKVEGKKTIEHESNESSEESDEEMETEGHVKGGVKRGATDEDNVNQEKKGSKYKRGNRKKKESSL